MQHALCSNVDTTTHIFYVFPIKQTGSWVQTHRVHHSVDGGHQDQGGRTRYDRTALGYFSSWQWIPRSHWQLHFSTTCPSHSPVVSKLSDIDSIEHSSEWLSLIYLTPVALKVENCYLDDNVKTMKSIDEWKYIQICPSDISLMIFHFQKV